MKDNSECASLRSNNVPKSEPVKDAKEIKDAQKDAVLVQMGDTANAVDIKNVKKHAGFPKGD